MRIAAAGILLALVVASAAPASAQGPPSAEAALEPTVATVGDPLTLSISVRHPAGTKVEPPDGADPFEPLDLIEARAPETRDASGGMQETRLVFTVAAFQTGVVHPLPLRMGVIGAQEDSISIDVPSVTIESVLPADGVAEPRGLPEPLAHSGGTPAWVWATLVMAGFVALSAATMALARVAVRQAPPAEPAAPDEPPEALARRELDAIGAASLLEHGDLKQHYERIATALRRFLSSSFGIPAGALTAQEIELRLEAAGADRMAARLAMNLLAQAEAVLFANYDPARERAKADLAAAYQVVALVAETPTSPAQGGTLVAP
jgi:hypothetical protein